MRRAWMDVGQSCTMQPCLHHRRTTINPNRDRYLGALVAVLSYTSSSFTHTNVNIPLPNCGFLLRVVKVFGYVSSDGTVGPGSTTGLPYTQKNMDLPSHTHSL